ncbi:sulfatase-like hydrolase/transferase [Rubinisphaera sp.]|uniref:sulfatase-like hydrolase/transferase n=1 Tax=Rubinisphaera sp. TaxID=2024857 RepID=UPI000C0CFE88|nr:sulfatase-like hydrolase/transferase [Rubinisphaera sp.]MBV11051.1 choline-sulfatase [Rubinisphaera sp.]HCS54986.1 choline-sulfatase [Planctomycetaceae bacterium]|tara:strand:+ start:5538 stop:6980 length:1443 start_codon:yes stop_codon:yes gene_type:complete
MRLLFLIVGLTLGLTKTVQAADKPNILFLFADDQRTDTIGAWGNPHIQTPNIDSLVEQGFSFRNNYCFGSNSGAVCMPSRAMVHSGRTWMHSNNNMDGEVTLGELLREQGYQTFTTGKWHNGRNSILRSFEHGQNVFMGGMSDHTRVPLSDIQDGQLISRGIDKDGFSSEQFADAAVSFLKTQKGEQPFFAYVAFTSPHDPRNPPEKYREMYYKNRPPLPENFQPQLDFNNSNLIIRDEMLAAWPREKSVISDQLCEYYGLITHMDEQIGRILKALDETGQRENTIIVYSADHGLGMGSHGLLGKQSVFEHSMKAPLIFVGPGIPQGKSSEAFTYLLDIYPTLCGQLEVKAPARVEGKSLSGIIKGEQKSVRDSIFLPYQSTQRSVRDERWKLCVYPQINFQQLFDLKNDPHEMHNLAEIPEYAMQKSKMLELMKTWQSEVGDEQTLTVKNPQPKTKDLTDHPRKPDAHQPKWIVEKYFD